MLEYMRQGGTIMWAIAALSFIAAAVAAERVLFFRSASGNAQKSEKDFAAALESGGAEKAGQVAAASDSSINRLLKTAAEYWRSTPDEMDLILEQQVRHEIFRWSKRIYILETVGKLAPLLGLLGTVLGMVEMFRSLHLDAQINAATVTGGIWKALFTTVAGLTVAIPTVFVHGLLNSRIDGEEETLNSCRDFIVRQHISHGKSEGKA